MLNLLTLNYWFDLSPEPFISIANTIIIAFLGLLLIGGILFLILQKKNKSFKVLFGKLNNFCFINLIIGVLLFFFSWEEAYFLSARFWYMLWIIIMIVWLLEIKKKSGQISDLRDKRKKRQEFEKYLP
jgi:LPXTG-motif cell wall-anchored protein